jgi:hypothetical protein
VARHRAQPRHLHRPCLNPTVNQTVEVKARRPNRSPKTRRGVIAANVESCGSCCGADRSPILRRIGKSRPSARLPAMVLATKEDRFRGADPYRHADHLNVSMTGVSTNIGRSGMWYTVGPRGTGTTFGLPGSGLYWTSHGHKKGSPLLLSPSPLIPKPTGADWLAIAAIGAVILVTALVIQSERHCCVRGVLVPSELNTATVPAVENPDRHDPDHAPRHTRRRNNGNGRRGGTSRHRRMWQRGPV